MIRSGTLRTLSSIFLAAASLSLLLPLAGCSKKLAGRGAPPHVRRHQQEYSLTHVVTAGETMARIAENYYGDPARAADIAGWNGLPDPDLLAVGSVLLPRFTEEQWDRAERRLAAMDPYNRGVDALRSGRLDEARDAFRQSLAIDPGFPDARYNLALIYLKRGLNADAAEILTGLLAEKPADRDFLFAYGNVLFHQADFDAAAEKFAAVLVIDPTDRRAAFSKARALTETGAVSEAEAAWEAYLALDRSSTWADEAREQLQGLRDGTIPAP